MTECFHCASKWRWAALVGVLLAVAAGARTSPEEDVLRSAARAGNVALFRAMIKAGANFNARDASGNNALVFAALSDHDDMVREVLTHKIDLNVRGYVGMTALGIATAHNAT
ncbi:MAG TPA: ankyrin repeat domain-containing protein, partial [Burkholderiaceae bacterium]|nr:ankyrin repeat domain-containing protein [Burkholderiaceae bacterium]